MIPTIVTHWGQDPKKLHATEEHLRENGVPSWSYYWGFPGRGLKVRKLPEVEYMTDVEELRGKYVGQNLTHWGLWSALKREAEQKPQTEYWDIIEDDFRFTPGYNEIYWDVMEDLPEDWDMVFLGSCCTQNQELIQITDNIYRGAGLCLHWYMVRKRALNILLETTKVVRGRMDAQMLEDAYPHLITYTVLPSLAHQHETELPV